MFGWLIFPYKPIDWTDWLYFLMLYVPAGAILVLAVASQGRTRRSK